MRGESSKSLLILTIAYGEGHRAAARGLDAHWRRNGGESLIVDALAESSVSAVYEWTRLYYSLCVSHVPFLWALTYDQTETTDWASMVRTALFKPILRKLEELVKRENPSLIVCTYPLYGYLLDYLVENNGLSVPYLMLVTDSIAISGPWMRSKADAWCMLDVHSRKLVIDRYALEEDKVCVAALPVPPRFAPSEESRSLQAMQSQLRILYSAYAPFDQVCDELEGLLDTYPQVRITVLAANKMKSLSAWTQKMPCDKRARLSIEAYRHDMDELFRAHDIYVGKAGAATLFEAYQSLCPVIINFALPGQELGNLDLLLKEGFGYYAEGARELCLAVQRLIAHNGSMHRIIRERMMHSQCRNGGDALIDYIKKTFF